MALGVSGRVGHGIGVHIDGDHPAGAFERGKYRQDTRAGAHIKHLVARVDVQAFDQEGAVATRRENPEQDQKVTPLASGDRALRADIAPGLLLRRLLLGDKRHLGVAQVLRQVKRHFVGINQLYRRHSLASDALCRNEGIARRVD